MRVRFWGTRGSLPATQNAGIVESKIIKALQAARGRVLDSDAEISDFVRGLPFHVRGTYGTNTSCIEIAGGNEYVLCDAGTGLRDFGNRILRDRKVGAVFHIFMSHLHWDHIQGFPFFVPAYIPGNRIHIYGCHEELEHAFENQQQFIHFPIELKQMRGEIFFHPLATDTTYEIAGFTVTTMSQLHPGDSYGYAFTRNGKKIVYSTDSEHKENSSNEHYRFLEFCKEADLFIFDAQYTLLDSIDTKESWGHSSNVIGVELAVRSGAKRLCLFHTEPTHDDEGLDIVLAETREYLEIHAGDHPMMIDVAYDGLEIDL